MRRTNGYKVILSKAKMSWNGNRGNRISSASVRSVQLAGDPRMEIAPCSRSRLA